MTTFYTAGQDLPKSKNGWTYCLVSKCGNYIKIGKTSCHTPLNRKQESNYAKNMSLSWSVNDARLESVFHDALSEFKASIVIVGNKTGKPVTKPENLTLQDYYTEVEAKAEGLIFEPASVAESLARQEEWIRARRRPNIELFHISPKKAKTRIKKQLPTLLT